MGLISSRQRSDPDVENLTAAVSYRYPPKSGNFFGHHFILGGERFETSQPEAYLFGENGDLNFLGSRPVGFPYSVSSSSNEPTRTVQSLVNIRRDSLKFIRCPPSAHQSIGQRSLKRTTSLNECDTTSVPSCSTRSSLSSTSKTPPSGAFGQQSNHESTDSGVSFRIPNVPSPVVKVKSDSSDPLTNCHLLKSLAKIVVPTRANTQETITTAVDLDSAKVDTAAAVDFADSSDDDEDVDDNSSHSHHHTYNLEFTFDCDCPVTITIYYFALEDLGSSGVSYLSQRPEMTSESFSYPMGEGQIFSQPSLIFDPSAFRLEDLRYDAESDVVPLVIHCVAENQNQSHSTLAVVEPSAEGHDFLLKPLKQKLFVDNVGYLLQEIYGIENKNAHDPSKAMPEESAEDTGHECVICMSEIRDTLILPCRHLCLCSTCAETLRYKASNCPICRSPFRALLQIKTLKKSKNSSFPNAFNSSNSEQNGSESGFLYRYETVTLVEALNGQIQKTPSAPPAVQRRSSSSTAAADSAKKSPMAPPRAAVKHGKKGARRAVSPIQEVLTVPHHNHHQIATRHAGDPDYAELPEDLEIPGAVAEITVVRTDSENRGSSPSAFKEYRRSSSRTSDSIAGGYHNQSFTANGAVDSETISVTDDEGQLVELKEKELLCNTGNTDSLDVAFPYRIMVNNSSSGALNDVDVRSNDDGAAEASSSCEGHQKRPSVSKRNLLSHRLSRSSDDIRQSSYELTDTATAQQESLDTLSGGEGQTTTPRLDLGTPATTRSGTPASNHSFSSVSSTKPLLKQNDSQKNFEDDVC